MSWITIDVGNTRIKIGEWSSDTDVVISTFATLEDLTNRFQDHWKTLPAIIASVRSDQDTSSVMTLFPQALLFSKLTDFPLINEYASPETLGMDRLANALAVVNYPSEGKLVVDFGTCLKFDFVIKDRYLGGAISPGLQMRFKAMHSFTGKLPLLTPTKFDVQLIGDSTVHSMMSGVWHGMRQEVLGIIDEYAKIAPELTIFLTGGDAHYFDIPSKKTIFVDENLTLRGLLIALQHAQS